MQKIVSPENVTHICWEWKASGTTTLLWGLSYCHGSNALRFSIWTPYCIKARQTKVGLSLPQIFLWLVKTFWKSVRFCVSLIKSSHWVTQLFSHVVDTQRSQKQSIVSPWWSQTQWMQGWKSIKSATQTWSVTMETSATLLAFLHGRLTCLPGAFHFFVMHDAAC